LVGQIASRGSGAGRISAQAAFAPAARLAPFAALIAGARAKGVSQISIRLADVGPFASAFWRVTLGPPLLWILGTEVAGMWA
jgi:hypothetical protein